MLVLKCQTNPLFRGKKNLVVFPFQLNAIPPYPSQMPNSLFVLPVNVILLAFHVLEVKVCSSHSLVDVLDVIACSLKMCGGIIGT